MNLKIKDIPISERPREKLLKYGKENLTDIELLSIILKTGTKEYGVTELSNRVLNKINKITNLKDININTFNDIKGIGEVKTIELLAVLELSKRIYLKTDNVIEKCNNTKTVYENNKYLFLDTKQECFYCLYLDNKKNLIERKLLFMGTINKSIVHPREIFKNAYLLSASSVICMHNHPSGDITPSIDDEVLTSSLKEIGNMQGIPLVDHIIFGNNTYYSFYEDGKI